MAAWDRFPLRITSFLGVRENPDRRVISIKISETSASPAEEESMVSSEFVETGSDGNSCCCCSSGFVDFTN